MGGFIALACLLIAMLLAFPTLAQDDVPLYFFNIGTATQPDGFGGEMPVARGDLFNYSADAWTDIRLSLTALNADDQVIGEGFGYLVDACGAALLDHALPPRQYQTFSVPYELFGEGEAARVKLDVDARRVGPAPPLPDMSAITQISQDEVVMLRWLDDDSLIFGVGCDGAVFTELDWQRYSLSDRALTEIQHPDASRVTPQLLENSGATMISQSGEINPDLYFTSQLTFPPHAQRVVFQNDVHSLFSAEPDGSFPRVIHDGLHQYSLRGFQWARQAGVFLAVYFGGYGEPVRYLAANADGQRLSLRLEDMPPSVTVPAPGADGLMALVGRRDGETSGYWLQHVFGGRELLLEADLPGNNFPAPILRGEHIYIVSPGEDAPTLQCYDRASRQLSTLSELPLRLTRTTRAWMWLSLDARTVALASNGAEGGLWLVDVAGMCADGR